MIAMTQTEWAARVAAIGYIPAWRGDNLQSFSRMPQPPHCMFMRFYAMAHGQDDPAVIAAIRQLLADWLAGVGVVAHRVCRWQCVGDGNWQCDCGFMAPYMQVAKWRFCPACGGKIEVTA
jgi:hypothetical protein